MKKVFVILSIVPLIFLLSCKGDPVVRKDNTVYFHASMQQLTDVIVDNIFSPPAASRVYVYPCIAAYEALQPAYDNYRSLAGQLTDFQEVPQPDTSKGDIYYPLASLEAFVSVCKAMVHTEIGIDSFAKKMMGDFKYSEMNRGTYERSLAYGDQVAAHVMNWVKEDNYNSIRGIKHTITDESGDWKPTGPAYMEAIEPFWNQIRPLIIDSATQFIPVRPTAFDTTKGSLFFKEVMEVFEVKQNLTDEQAEIAAFWDCNPYVMNVTGHAMYATKKITPGGHWIGIVKIASKQANLDIMETIEAYTRTSIALADAFISCWDEKYRSNLIRPETVIQKHIDPTWQPLLQTPPFPEYTSGHSVISTAAAIALTELLGESFEFIDSTEVIYGLPPRSFPSFIAASEEAAISRLYGGIHYIPAIRNGQSQGRKVGQYINANLVTRTDKAMSSKK